MTGGGEGLDLPEAIRHGLTRFTDAPSGLPCVLRQSVHMSISERISPRLEASADAAKASEAPA
jgi:hypothetical protein